MARGRGRQQPGVPATQAGGKRWAISPDGSDKILQLAFEKEFGLLVDLFANPEEN